MASGWPAISAMNMSGKFPNECTAHRLQSRAVVENPKIAVIGGGSTYTPELIEGLGRLAERILRKQGFAGRLVSTTDRACAIDGAAFVLVQLRVGGLAARLKDETIPPKFGCLGQETTGAGGFAKALRT